MKRVLLLVIVFLSLSSGLSFAGDTELMTLGIESYKSGNYADCITKMKTLVKNDPTSAVGYYYLGLAYAKTGRKFLAVRNYDKVIALNSDKTLIDLARVGKQKAAGESVTAIEAEIKDIEEEAVESQHTEKAEKLTPAELRQKYEEKITKNDNKQEAKTTRTIKASDYAQANAQPTNDEIVNAIKVLQKAGLLNSMNMGGYNPQMDPKTQQMNAMMMMMNNGNNNNGMMNMMPFMNNNGKPDPQMIQMMMMNQMMPNFSSGNNNNGY